jgi:hypothetical protein
MQKTIIDLSNVKDIALLIKISPVFSVEFFECINQDYKQGLNY